MTITGTGKTGFGCCVKFFFLRNLDHPHVSRLIGLFPNNPLAGGKFRYLHIVTEYYDAGSLNQHNVKSVEEALSIQIQILSGLEYLHSHKILHRDIKRENVFLRATDGHVVIGDLGLSRGMVSQMTAEVVTKPYRCMSLLLGRTYYGPEIDIYAAGIVFLEMLFCKRNTTLLPNKKTAFKTFLKHQMVIGRDDAFSRLPADLSLLAQAMHVDLEELFLLPPDETLAEWGKRVWDAVPAGDIAKFAQSMVTLNYRKRPSAKELVAAAEKAVGRRRSRIGSLVALEEENFNEKIALLETDELRGLAVKKEIWKLVADVHVEWQRHGFPVWFPGEEVEPEEPVCKRTRLALAKR